MSLYAEDKELELLKRIREKMDLAVLLARVCPHKRKEMCRLGNELVDLALEVCGLKQRTLEKIFEAKK